MSVVDRPGGNPRRDLDARPWLPAVRPEDAGVGPPTPAVSSPPPGPPSIRADLVALAALGLLTAAVVLAAPGEAGATAVLAALAGTVATWFLARRLPLPVWCAVLAVVLSVVAPAAVAAAGEISRSSTATPLALTAIALAVGADRRLRRSGAVLLACAAVVAPHTALLLPAFVVVGRRRGAERPGRHCEVAALSALVVAAAVVGTLLGGRWPVFDPWAGWSAGVADLVVPAVLVIATGVGLLVRRLRPVAAAGALVLLAVLAGGGGSSELVRLLVPVGALLVAGAVFAVARYRPTRLGGADVRRTGAVAGVLAGAGVVVLVAPAWTAGWERVLSADPASTSAAAPATAASSPPVAPGAPPSPTAFPRPSPTRSPTPPPTRTVEPQTSAESADAGRELARNPFLELSAPARADLLAGRVDLRLVTVLALLAPSYELGVEAFPAVDGGGEPLRSVTITTVDGTSPARDAPATVRLRADLARQPEAYRPQSALRAGTDTGLALLLTLDTAKP